MKKSEQLPSRQHIIYINECAMALFSKLNFEKGKWFDCLKEALRQHREYLIRCVEERKKIEAERLPNCEICGFPMSQIDVWNYVSYCHPCWKKKYVDAVCCPVRGPRLTNTHTIKPRPPHICL